jgi:zinc transporter ZupT
MAQISIINLMIYSFSVTLVAIGGGLLPLFKKWTDRQLHMFVAFGAGTILGAIFFHLLPDSLELGSPKVALAMVFAGFIIVFLIERMLRGGHVHAPSESALHKHQVVGITALVGLSVHTLIGGFGLAAGMVDPEVGFIIFIAIIVHKATEAFSLSTIFRLADFSLRKSLLLLALYSLLTPIGALVSLPFVEALNNINLSIPTGLTAGTFFYVAVFDLLPEAFHAKGGKLLPFALLLAGAFIMYAIKLTGV